MLIDAPPEIIVTGRALAQPVAERPIAVTVIDHKSLERSPVTGLEQVVQQAAGVQLFRRSDARSANPTSQGVTLRALGGNASSRALLVLDGVPQTDPFGGWVYWPAYDALALQEVRITRGGGSVGLGPGALAGTIELTSALARGLAAGLEVGSRNSGEARFRAAESVGGGVASLTVRAATGDGFVPTSRDTRGPADQAAPYRNASVRLRWVRAVGADTELQASLSGFVDERSRGLAFSDNESRGADASLRVVGRGMWQWSALGYAQWRGLESSFAATDAARTTARRTSLQYDVPGRALGGSLEVRPPVAALAELRFGADARLMTGESNEFGSYVAGAPTRDRRSGGQTSHAGLFAEAAWRNGSVLLSAGARVDRWTISNGFNRELVVGSGAVVRDQAYARRSGWLPTGRAGLELSGSDGLSLRGAAYLGWRLPTINELFRPFRLGQDATGANPFLEPERLAGAEVGARLRRESLNLDLTAFLNRLAGPIANVTIGRGPGTFPDIGFVGAGGLARQRQNLQAITVHGVEASASVSRGPWTAALSASAVRARVAAGLAADLQGLRPAQTPARSASLQLGWAAGGSVASLQLRYMGAQFEDDLNRIELPSAVTADLFGAVPLSGRWQLVGRVENLFDEEVVAAITSDGVVERATPRTLWLGLRFRQP